MASRSPVIIEAEGLLLYQQIDQVDLYTEIAREHSPAGQELIMLVGYPVGAEGQQTLRCEWAVARRIRDSLTGAREKWLISILGHGTELVLFARQNQDRVSLRYQVVFDVTLYTRMYQSCWQPPSVVFESQFIYGHLPAWPAVGSMAQHEGLNSQQSRLVAQLAQAKRGLYFIRGVAGTGKTTTLVALIGLLAQQSKRLLITAPSEQALRVLLRQCQASSWWTDRASALLVDHTQTLDLQEESDVQDYLPSRWLAPLLAIEVRLQQANGRPKALQDLHQLLCVIYADLQLFWLTAYDQNRIAGVSDVISDMLTSLDEFVCCCEKSEDQDAASVVAKAVTLLRTSADSVAKFMLARAQLLFATLSATARPWLRDHLPKVDVVLVDDAGQAMVPEVLLPLFFQPNLCIQAGDFQQRSLGVVSQVAQQGGLNVSMGQCLLNQSVRPYGLLMTQYRMHAEIADWPMRSHQGCFHNVWQRVPLWRMYPAWPSSLCRASLFFNTGEEVSVDDKQLSLIARLLQLLLSFGVLPGRIAVLSFYQTQLMRLRQVLKSHLIVAHFQSLFTGLVESLRGNECDVILLATLPASSHEWPIDDERLHVAMTRAKHVRWLCGDQKRLAESYPTLKGFIEDHAKKGAVRQADCLRVIGCDYHR